MIKMFKTWFGIYNCNISNLSTMYSMESKVLIYCRSLG